MRTIRMNHQNRTVLAILCLALTVCMFGVGGKPALAASMSDRITLEPEKSGFFIVGDVLLQLGKLHGLNFSITEAAYNKKFSVFFTNVTIEEALNRIATAAKLDIKKSGAIDYAVDVQPDPTPIPAPSEDSIRQQQESKFLEDFMVDSIETKYIPAKDAKDAVMAMFGDKGKEYCQLEVAGQTAAQEGGSGVIAMSNLILIRAKSQNMIDLAKRLVKLADRPRPMIDLEVTFIDLTNASGSEVGLDWTLFKDGINWAEEAVADTELFGSFRVGKITRTTPFDATALLSMTKSTSKAKILSNPTVRLISGYKSSIKAGQQRPIITLDKDQQPIIDYKDIGVYLDVTGLVQKDGTIFVDMHVQASAVTGEITKATATAPIIANREAEVKLYLKSGETMVLGGLMDEKTIKSLSKFPGLGDLPLIGGLFRTENSTKEHSTLVILVRPTIVKASVTGDSEQDRKMMELLDRTRDGNFADDGTKDDPMLRERHLDIFSQRKIDVYLDKGAWPRSDSVGVYYEQEPMITEGSFDASYTTPLPPLD